MRTIKFEQPFIYEGKPLEANKEYIVDEAGVGEVLLDCLGRAEIKKLEAFTCKGTINQTLVIRAGGAGDLLFMEPATRQLNNPIICCSQIYRWIYPDTIQFPISLEEAQEYKQVFIPDYVGEHIQGNNLIESYAKALQVSLTNKVPKYSSPPEVVAKINGLYPKAKKRIGFCAYSTSWLRDYPFEQFEKVWKTLYQDLDNEICFIGRKGSIETDNVPRVINLTQTDLSWEEQVAFISTCDVFVGNDSGNTHFAGALNVPTIALFGSFHWKDRTSNFKSVKALQGQAKCAPCYHHPNLRKPKPDNCEATGQVCKAMASIDYERIVKEVRKLL